MNELDIGLGKGARRGWGLGDLVVVPSRRSRDADGVDLSWSLDAYRLDAPFMTSPSDAVSGPDTAPIIIEHGGIPSLHAEGLWARHADPRPLLEEVAALAGSAGDGAQVVEVLRRAMAEPIVPELLVEHVAAVRSRGGVACLCISPQRAEALLPVVLKAEPDLLVIRGTFTSAEHVSAGEPLDLKAILRRLEVPVIVGGVASYSSALHLMRTGAAAVLVGVGPAGAESSRAILGMGAPLATAIADVRAARMRHLDETGVYCQIIVDGGVRTSGEWATAVACGADAAMLAAPLATASEAPAGGWLWGQGVVHRSLPKSWPERVERVGTLAEVLAGPAVDATGRSNLLGGLRKAVALAGYANLKEFQKADLMAIGGGA